MGSDVTANAVADYIIAFYHDHGDCITNLELQKLLYYSQAWHLAIDDKPLFPGKFQAWVHGPVHPETYRRFKRFLWKPITTDVGDRKESNLPNKAKLFIEEVLDAYSGFSAYQLERMTHAEDPWRNARGDLPMEEESQEEISEKDMRDFYRARLDG